MPRSELDLLCRHNGERGLPGATTGHRTGNGSSDGQRRHQFDEHRLGRPVALLCGQCPKFTRAGAPEEPELAQDAAEEPEGTDVGCGAPGKRVRRIFGKKT